MIFQPLFFFITPQLLKKLSIEQDVAIVVVTHDERMLPLFDRILRVEDGVVREEQ